MHSLRRNKRYIYSTNCVHKLVTLFQHCIVQHANVLETGLPLQKTRQEMSKKMEVKGKERVALPAC